MICHDFKKGVHHFKIIRRVVSINHLIITRLSTRIPAMSINLDIWKVGNIKEFIIISIKILENTRVIQIKVIRVHLEAKIDSMKKTELQTMITFKTRDIKLESSNTLFNNTKPQSPINTVVEEELDITKRMLRAAVPVSRTLRAGIINQYISPIKLSLSITISSIMCLPQMQIIVLHKERVGSITEENPKMCFLTGSLC